MLDREFEQSCLVESKEIYPVQYVACVLANEEAECKHYGQADLRTWCGQVVNDWAFENLQKACIYASTGGNEVKLCSNCFQAVKNYLQSITQ